MDPNLVSKSGFLMRRHLIAGRISRIAQPSRRNALALALGEAMEFQNHIGRPRIERRIHTLAAHLKTRLQEIPGLRLHTNTDNYLSVGLTAFSIKGVNGGQLMDYLREKHNIVVRTIGSEQKGTAGVRVSTHIFVTLKDVDLLAEGIRSFVALRP